MKNINNFLAGIFRKNDNIRENPVLEALHYEEEVNGQLRVTRVSLIICSIIMTFTTYLFFTSVLVFNNISNVIISFAGFSFHLFFYFYLKKRERYRKIFKYMTNFFNATLVTLNLSFYSVDMGWLHSLRTMVIAVYFIIIITSGFYQRTFIVIFTTLVVIAEYSAMFLYALFTGSITLSKTIETFYDPLISVNFYFSYILFFLMAGTFVAFISSRFGRVMEQALKSEAKAHETEISHRILKETMNIKSNFFVNFAHEMKTPLTLISNYYKEYIKSSPDNYEGNVIRYNLEKLKKDIINFLDLENLEKGKYDYSHNQIINITETVKMSVLLFKELAAKKNIKMDFKSSGDIYTKIDPFALDRIINNLIENAVKYTNKNGEINIGLYTENDNIEFTVRDTGIGIPEDQTENIFKPYYQLSHKKANFQGLGLGLSIVKKITEEVQGSITVESRINEGSIFKVSLKKYDPDDNEKNIKKVSSVYDTAVLNDSLELPQEEAFNDLKTIFIAEDNHQMLLFLIQTLKKKYNVFYAKNGSEALEKLKKMPLPKLIISDIMMDKLDGFGFYNELIKEKRYASIPFVFLTALTTSEQKIKGLSMGAVDYIYKPFQIEELTAKIESLIKIQESLKRENLLRITRELYRHLKNKAMKNKNVNIDSTGEDSIKNLYKEFGISTQQIKIISLLKEGLLRKEISEKLGITINSLKTQMKRLFDKCKVDNKTELLNIFY